MTDAAGPDPTPAVVMRLTMLHYKEEGSTANKSDLIQELSDAS